MSVWKSDETLFSVFHLVMKHCVSCLILREELLKITLPHMVRFLQFLSEAAN